MRNTRYSPYHVLSSLNVAYANVTKNVTVAICLLFNLEALNFLVQTY